jgi:hypothetical protein
MAFERDSGGGSDNGVMLNIEPGKSVDGVVVGDPVKYYGVFSDSEGGARKFVEGTKGDAQGSKLRFKVNFAHRQPDGQYVMKIFSGGGKLYDDLCDLFGPESEGGVGYKQAEQLVRVSREGSGKATKWHILPIKRTLTYEETVAISMLTPLQIQK